MPAWAGFLSEEDVVHIYKYVKGEASIWWRPAGPLPSRTEQKEISK